MAVWAEGLEGGDGPTVEAALASCGVVSGHPGVVEGLRRRAGRPLRGALQAGTGGGPAEFDTPRAAPQGVRAQWWRRRALGLAEGDAAGDAVTVGGSARLRLLLGERGRGGHFV